jgi:tight adherence protein B
MAIPILFLVFCTVALIIYTIVPIIYNKSVAVGQKRAQNMSSRLDRVMPRAQVKQVTRIYMLAPIFGAGAMYFIFPAGFQLVGVITGFITGFFFPGIYTKILISRNREKFDNQLVDALMIMSSSFRGGLSLIQAMEAVVEEMPDPINQEFSTLLGENKMGVSLDEALDHMYKRMPSSALQQMTTAILLARETGGNLPAIFSRIVNTIRESKRIQQQIDTLTLQGKIQGVVMSLLPIAFFVVIYGSNPMFFDHMFVSKMGKMLLIYSAFSEVIGAVMIWKISSIKDF